MAKGTAPDQFVVVSQVRAGLKRELQFALKSQSEICGGSLGRTRARKTLNGGSDAGAGTPNRISRRNSKRLKGGYGLKIEGNDFDESDGVVNLEEEEAKSDVVDQEDAKGDLVESMNTKLFNDEAVIAILDEDSALVETMRGIDGKQEESEPERAVYDKFGKENEMDMEMETDHGNVVADGDKNVEKPGTKPPKKRLVMDEEEKIEGGMESANSSLKAENCSVDKPLRRFTRSLLKRKGETNMRDAKSDDSNSPVRSSSKRAVNRLVKDQGLTKEGEEELVKKLGKEGDAEEKNCVRASNGSSKSASVPFVRENGSADKPLRRFTRSLLKQEAGLDESDVRDEARPTNFNVFVNDGDDEENDNASDPPLSVPLKPQRPKKFSQSFPQRLNDLLESGILEGLIVYYVKSRGAGTTGLKGIIKGSGILCFCYACKGAQVLTPAMYELHASSSNKRPPEYILLENGKTLRDVMNACKETPLEKLEETLLMVVGPSMKESNFCLNCREPITVPSGMKTLVLCSSCMELKESQKVSRVSSPELTDAIVRRISCVELKEPQKVSQHSSAKASDVMDRCVSCVELKELHKLSQDSSAKASNIIHRSPVPNVSPKTIHSEPRCTLSKSSTHGRITRKDTRLHKLVFEEDVLPDGTEVAYFVRGKKMLEGYKKEFGIQCSCCSEVISPSQFEAHAGYANRRKPFQQIYTSNGVSLHELSVALSKDRKFSTKENDDLCSICGKGGDLLCCDTCPRSFHAGCASLPGIPNGSWSCKYCQNMLLREKFVEHNVNAIAAGRVEGVDAIAEITKRCIRIVNSLGTGLPSVCVLCRGHNFRRLGFGPRTVIICDQCEKEFHVGCLKEHNIDDLKELPEGQWFCGADCNKIYNSMQKLVINGVERLPASFLDFVKKKQNPHEENPFDNNSNPDIRWSVLRGKYSPDDNKVLLSKAVSIFHERFDPISESGTRGDLIPAMVYGRQFKGQDFSGMYCALLTVNEVIVSVGIFRIFGSELAELPLVATSSDCQGQGYFQCLFSCIERLLGFLDIRNLVLPAADEAKSIWTDKFGFSKMTEDEVIEYRKDFQMMIFEGTSMLRKPVAASRVFDKPVEKTEK